MGSAVVFILLFLGLACLTPILFWVCCELLDRKYRAEGVADSIVGGAIDPQSLREPASPPSPLLAAEIETDDFIEWHESMAQDFEPYPVQSDAKLNYSITKGPGDPWSD